MHWSGSVWSVAEGAKMTAQTNVGSVLNLRQDQKGFALCRKDCLRQSLFSYVMVRQQIVISPPLRVASTVFSLRPQLDDPPVLPAGSDFSTLALPTAKKTILLTLIFFEEVSLQVLDSCNTKSDKWIHAMPSPIWKSHWIPSVEVSRAIQITIVPIPTPLLVLDQA